MTKEEYYEQNKAECLLAEGLLKYALPRLNMDELKHSIHHYKEQLEKGQKAVWNAEFSLRLAEAELEHRREAHDD